MCEGVCGCVHGAVECVSGLCVGVHGAVVCVRVCEHGAEECVSGLDGLCSYCMCVRCAMCECPGGRVSVCGCGGGGCTWR